MRFLTSLLLLLLPLTGFAATTQDTRGAFAQALSKELYCQVATTMSGNVGILIGLAIAAMGFIFLIFHGASMKNLLMIFAGVLITAVPGWFEAGLDSLATITSNLQEDKDHVTAFQNRGKFAGSSSTCDFGSDALRPALNVTDPTDPNYVATGGTYTGDPADYLAEVAQLESASGCVSGVGATCVSSNDCIGLYQFCEGSGIDKTTGYSSWNAFKSAVLGNKALQDQYITLLHDNNMTYFNNSGISQKWIGKTVTYQGNTFTITETALRMASQIGIGNVANTFKAIENNDYSSIPRDNGGKGVTMFYWLSGGTVK